jgi:subtilase family serine protease
VPTATRALPLSHLAALGPVPAGRVLPVTIGLTLRNQNELQRDIAAGVVLPTADFVRRFAPNAADVGAVEGYMRQEGFTAVTVSANRLLVSANATVDRIQAAFHTTLNRFVTGLHTTFANTAPVRLPARLAGIVSGVLGLNNLPAKVAANAPPTCGTGPRYGCVYNPQGFWAAYDATSAATGAATSVAVFAAGSLAHVVNDLRAEETATGLPRVPVTVEPVGAPSADESGLDEWDLDTQYSAGMAGSVHQLYIYDATDMTETGLTAMYNQFVTDNLARAGSSSIDQCELFANLDGSMAVEDQIFEQAAAQGQTVFNASGDAGGLCALADEGGVRVGPPGVAYPASSPFVIGVGGTTLLTDVTGSYTTELAWTMGGGGPSLFEHAPSWQTAPRTGVVRDVPDVAMDADPSTGANVYVDGAPTGIGGTSLSSPLALGVWARLESSSHNTLGFAGPLLYAHAGTAAFHDVVLGFTTPFPALPGYDLATGLGSFDVARSQATISR